MFMIYKTGTRKRIRKAICGTFYDCFIKCSPVLHIWNIL